MKDNFYKIIETLDIHKAIDYLKILKENGRTQDEVYKLLEDLRKELKNEEQEDFILDIMDIVSGWISPDKKIW